MKKIVSLVMLATLLTVPVVSFAQKIGFVDAQKIFMKYDEKNGISKKMQEQFSDKQKELEDLSAKFQSLEKKLKTDSLLMSEDQLDGSRKKMQEVLLEARNKEMAFKKELQQAQRNAMGEISKVVSEVIRAYGKEKKFDIIFESGAVYVADSINVTDQIWSRLDKKKK